MMETEQYQPLLQSAENNHPSAPPLSPIAELPSHHNVDETPHTMYYTQPSLLTPTIPSSHVQRSPIGTRPPSYYAQPIPSNTQNASILAMPPEFRLYPADTLSSSSSSSSSPLVTTNDNNNSHRPHLSVSVPPAFTAIPLTLDMVLVRHRYRYVWCSFRSQYQFPLSLSTSSSYISTHLAHCISSDEWNHSIERLNASLLWPTHIQMIRYLLVLSILGIFSVIWTNYIRDRHLYMAIAWIILVLLIFIYLIVTRYYSKQLRRSLFAAIDRENIYYQSHQNSIREGRGICYWSLQGSYLFISTPSISPHHAIHTITNTTSTLLTTTAINGAPIITIPSPHDHRHLQVSNNDNSAVAAKHSYRYHPLITDSPMAHY